jgi:hypothetical protein
MQWPGIPRPFFYFTVRSWLSEVGTTARQKSLFIVFVDVMFTNLLEALFTNAFDVHSQASAHPCVWRACIAD